MIGVLHAHGVRFVVVGGIAAVLQGAPIVTFDLDVVHSRDEDNVKRLLAALAELDARSRLHGAVVVRPDRSHLVGPGHVLLATVAGDLDVLGTAGTCSTYEDLAPTARKLELEPGLIVEIADLPDLIRLKAEAGRPKDLAALPTLRATLEERQRRGE